MTPIPDTDIKALVEEAKRLFSFWRVDWDTFHAGHTSASSLIYRLVGAVLSLQARAEAVEAERDTALTDRHDTILDLRRDLETAERQRDLAAEALKSAAGWFDDYASQHEAKCTDDGDRKARTNRNRAGHCRAALAQIKAEKNNG